MTEENTSPEPTESELKDIEFDERIKSLMKVHEIERKMLSRAIYVLCDMSGKSPEETVKLLSQDLDEEYVEAVKQAEEQEKAEKNKPKLYIPNRKLNL